MALICSMLGVPAAGQRRAADGEPSPVAEEGGDGGRPAASVQVATVDSFQGAEKEVCPFLHHIR